MLNNLRDKLSNLGVGPHNSSRENRITKLLNEISVFIFLLAVTAFIFQICKYQYLIGKSLPHTWLMLATFSPIILVLPLNKHQHHYLARFFFILHNIFINVFWTFMVGSVSGLTYSYLIFPIPICILFRGLKTQIALVVLSFFGFLSCRHIGLNYEAYLSSTTNIEFSVIAFSIWLLLAYLMMRIFTSEIAVAEEQLEIKNSELEQFSRVASHDMKEPLRTIASFSSLIQHKYKEKLDPELTGYIDFINDSSIRLGTLVDDLLIYSTLKKNQEEMSPVQLNTVLDEVTKNLSASIQETGTLITSDSLPKVIAFKSRMIQLFQNIISNAIKFQPKKEGHVPHITISYKALGPYNIISFKDNGIGIAKEELKSVFKNFHRLHRRDEYEGSGLGLGTCKKIVELHDGKIQLFSSLNMGTQIDVHLLKI